MEENITGLKNAVMEAFKLNNTLMLLLHVIFIKQRKSPSIVKQ